MCRTESRVRVLRSLSSGDGEDRLFQGYTVPELRLEGGLSGCPSSQRGEYMQRRTGGDHDGMFRNFQGFSLTGTGKGLLSVWQVMGLKKHSVLWRVSCAKPR